MTEADPPLALEGLRVLEDGGGIAAAYAGKLLADLGADVIKVESPLGGDSVRRRRPFPADRPGRETSGLHLFLDTQQTQRLSRSGERRRSTAVQASGAVL